MDTHKWYVYSKIARAFVEVEGKAVSIPSWKGFNLFFHAPLATSMLSSAYLVLSEARSGGIVTQAGSLSELRKNANKIMKHFGSTEVLARIAHQEVEHGISPRYSEAVK